MCEQACVSESWGGGEGGKIEREVGQTGNWHNRKTDTKEYEGGTPMRWREGQGARGARAGNEIQSQIARGESECM